MKRQICVLAVSIAAVSLLGCDSSLNRTPNFEPNFLYAHALEKSEDVDLTQPLMDSSQLVEEWFGTLDEPKIPPLFAEEYADLLSLENLKMAAGAPPASAEPGTSGLYRQQCASCHGESGQGRGPVAASQNPYPREFRHGWFKYKSPNRQSKPLKEDLKRILVNGLADSQMPRFTKLNEKQIDSLVDYVIYLSIRGEFERKLLYLAAYDLDLETARIYNASWKSSVDEKEKTSFQEQVDAASEILTEIADAWNDAIDRVEEFSKPSFPIFGKETDENRSSC
jgi:mono/diheme cytochrome c family protein